MGTADILRKPDTNPNNIKEITFGPYVATQADLILPLCPTLPIVIEKVTCSASTKPSVGSNFNLMRRLPATDGSIANTVTAARKIITTFDLNTLTNNTQTNLPLASTSNVPDHNVIAAGEQIVADFATTTAMADFYITVRYRQQELV